MPKLNQLPSKQDFKLKLITKLRKNLQNLAKIRENLDNDLKEIT